VVVVVVVVVVAIGTGIAHAATTVGVRVSLVLGKVIGICSYMTTNLTMVVMSTAVATVIVGVVVLARVGIGVFVVAGSCTYMMILSVGVVVWVGASVITGGHFVERRQERQQIF
jgi:hypothetical protein